MFRRFRPFPLQLLLLPVLGFLILRGSQAAETAPAAAPARLAIAAPLSADAPAAWRQAAADWAGLVTAELSQEPTLTLVERTRLAQLTDEQALSLAQGGGTNAIRAGRLLGADLLLVGTLWRNPATNLWVLRLLDARSGIVCDAGLVPVGTGAPLEAAVGAARFVRQANRRPEPDRSPRFIALGAFEDVGLGNRQPDFAQWVRHAIESRSAGTRIVPVERQQAGALLAELRLRLGSFVADTDTNRIEPALLVVDGVYQTTQDQGAGLDLVLRIERVGGEARTRSLREPVGPALAAHVAEFVAAGFAELKATNSPGGRTAEAALQLARGNELARLPRALGMNWLELGGFGGTVPEPQRRRNTVQAAEAFAAAVALAPDNAEAKLGLAVCWMSPFLDRRTEGRDLLREVIAATTNRPLALTAYAQLAESYAADQPDTARKLHRMLAAELTDPVAAEVHLDSYGELTGWLFRKGRLSEADMAVAEDAMIDRACAKAAGEGRFDAHMLGANTLGVMAHWRHLAPAGADDHYAGLIQRLALRNPAFAPYFVAGLTDRYNEPTAWLLQVLGELLTRCEEQPEHMASPSIFYADTLPDLLEWYATHHQEAAAVHCGAILQKHHVRLSNQRQVELAYSLRQLGRLEEAVALLRPFESAQFVIDRDGPWGTAHTTLKVSRLLAEWEGNSPTPGGNVPMSFDLGLPRLTLGDEFVFTAGSDRIWLGDGLVPLVFDLPQDAIRLLPHAPVFRQPIHCVTAGGDRVWFGTEGDGLYEYRPADGRWQHFSVSDGLLLDHVTALLPQPGRLWVGFGSGRHGGVGYQDLKTGHWVMLTPPLPSSVAAARDVQEEGPFDYASAQAPRGRVTALTTRGEVLFVLAPDSGVHRFDREFQKWLPVVRKGSVNVFGLAATARFLVGAGPFSPLQSLRLDAPSPRAMMMELPNLAFPNQRGRCVTAGDGDQVWLGGDGYLACVDLDGRKITLLCEPPRPEDDGTQAAEGIRIRSIQLSGDRLWVAAGRNLHEVRLPVRPPTSPPAR